jgi:hypothetical protein
MEEKIYELCEIESIIYLDYYNGKYSYDSFEGLLGENQPKIINLVYNLLDEGYEEKDIISGIKRQGGFYKKSPEWFGEDDGTSNYPSGYYETNKNKKYPFYEKCGNTLSLVKKFFKARKSVKVELSLRDKLHEEGVRELIVSHIDASKNKKSKSKKNKKSKRKRGRKSKGQSKRRRSKNR